MFDIEGRGYNAIEGGNKRMEGSQLADEGYEHERVQEGWFSRPLLLTWFVHIQFALRWRNSAIWSSRLQIPSVIQWCLIAWRYR